MHFTDGKMKENEAFQVHRRDRNLCFLPSYHLMFNKRLLQSLRLEVIGFSKGIPLCLYSLCKLRGLTSGIFGLYFKSSDCQVYVTFLHLRYTYLKFDIDIIVYLRDMEFFNLCLH